MMLQMEIEYLEQYNPWWRTGKVKESWLKPYKRTLYSEITKYINKRQIILIQGLRRLGKTTLLFQIIHELLKDVEPKYILYFSFDEHIFDIKEVLETYQKVILNRTFDDVQSTIYIFLDEVHKVADWEIKLKTYYDIYPRLKFFISGSASLSLRRKSKESLAGRVFDFTLEPLSFEEFLTLSGKEVEKIKRNPQLWKRELIPLLYKYIKFGTFPELVNEEDEEIARRYIINNIIERIIYKDLPEEFRINDMELLKSLIYIIGKNPGMIVNYKELSKELGRDERTISNYFEYLEFGLLTKFVFNYRGSPVASLRKLKRIYFRTPNIIFAYNPNLDNVLPVMLENLVMMVTGAGYFYRNSFEIDFILSENKSLVAIEVKSRHINTKQLRKFIREYGKKVKKSFIVDFESEETIDEFRVIPAWKLALNLF